MSSLPIFVIDSFTDIAFKGNPAAVCILSSPLPDGLQQKIAAEMNLSETAFVLPLNSSSYENTNQFSLRWFTPTVEVELYGHATLAAAFVLYEQMNLSSSDLIFHTLKGELTVRKDTD